MLVGIVTGVSMSDDAEYGPIIGMRDILVACALEADGVLQPTPNPCVKREHFSFAHEGHIDDITMLGRRIAPRRAFQIATYTHAETLFAFILTCMDSVEDPDAAILRAISGVASAGARGNFNFMLSTEQSLYAHCGGPPAMVLIERHSAIIISTRARTHEPGRLLSRGALVRVDRGPAPSWRLLTTRPSGDASDPELPFTD